MCLAHWKQIKSCLRHSFKSAAYRHNTICSPNLWYKFLKGSHWKAYKPHRNTQFYTVGELRPLRDMCMFKSSINANISKRTHISHNNPNVKYNWVKDSYTFENDWLGSLVIFSFGVLNRDAILAFCIFADLWQCQESMYILPCFKDISVFLIALIDVTPSGKTPFHITTWYKHARLLGERYCPENMCFLHLLGGGIVLLTWEFLQDDWRCHMAWENFERVWLIPNCGE